MPRAREEGSQADQARSIKRTLEVLEYFDEDHPAASVGEISRELGYPQSSTSILMRSLMTLGYLSYDDRTRTYRPTARIALLGRGIRLRLFGDGSLMAAIDEISAKTGELVFLAARAGLAVHYIHVVQGTNPLRMHLRAGATRPLVGAATGYLFLSADDDDAIAATVERAIAAAPTGTVPDLDEVMREVRQIRLSGHVLSTRTYTPGGGVLGMLLPLEIDQQPLALCIGGVGSILVDNSETLLRAMRDAVDHNLRATTLRSA